MKKRVLLVEDDDAIAGLVSKWLSQHQDGFSVVTAGHGQEALDILAHQPADIVVTDLQMPVMDGFELIAHLLSEQVNLPIVILTAMAVSDVESRLHQIGALPVIRKPFSVSTLYTVICNELNARQQGVIQGLTLASFLQLLEMERKSCVLRIAAGGRVGYLYFSNGDLVHAETGDRSGEPAAYDILLWEGVKLQMTPPPPVPPPCTLHDRLMGLLMEAFRRRDEAAEALRRTSKSATLEDTPTPTATAAEDQEPLAELSAAVHPSAAHHTPASALQTAELLLTLADRLLHTKVEDTRTYVLAPDLRRRLEANALPQQTVGLLRLFDGRRTLGELLAAVPNEALVFLFLVGGLRAAGLLQETETPVATSPGAT
ncbi:MAG: response regulator [Chloracidobacterium sp.]|nr:response regulator [Chloracidobacterium sp.]MDW8217372.1 response regulator [Acidobacteriota bacterium]